MSEEQMEIAMSIILTAGDARLQCKEALDAIAAFDFELAKEKMKESQANIRDAHNIQTDAIQAETRGEKSEYSLLFAHAQDTLMTITSEINVTKQLIKIFSSLEARLKKLEESENA